MVPRVMPGAPITPRLFLCNAPFGRDVAAVRDYVAAGGYDGVEWGLDNLRVAVARGRRDWMLDGFRKAAPLTSLHAPYTDLELGHCDAEYARAALRILQEYVDVAAEAGAHHLNLHVGSHGLGPEVTGGTHPYLSFSGLASGASTTVYTVPNDRIFVMTAAVLSTTASIYQGTTLKVSGASRAMIATSTSAGGAALNIGNAKVVFDPGSTVVIREQRGLLH